MRPIYITAAAMAGLSLAAPAPAQHYQPTHLQAPNAPAPSHWGHDRTYSQGLQVQIDAGMNRGTISRRESIGLREDLARLVRLERQFSPNGINGREHAQLIQRSTALAQDIRVASRDGNRRDDREATSDGRSMNGHWAPDAKFAGLSAGDRFAGDPRVGQRVSATMVDLPPEYREQYVNNDRVYYGYDNGRVYQVDRQSQMILALLDIAR